MIDQFFKLFQTNKIPSSFSFYKEALKNKTSDLVFFDTETTGLDTTNDEVLSIGALRFSKNTLSLNQLFYREIAVFQGANSAVEIHELITEKTGEAEVLVLKEFIRFIGGCTLVGHHVAFDVKMINKLLQRNFGFALENSTVDTCLMAIKNDFGGHIPALNNLEKYSLDNLCNRYKIEIADRHHALGDAFLTAQLYLKLV